MTNMQNTMARTTLHTVQNTLGVILGLLVILVFMTFLLQDVVITVAAQGQETHHSSSLVCNTGETQTTRYAGQVTGMGCNCQTNYRVVSDDAPLGPVEWEVCN